MRCIKEDYRSFLLKVSAFFFFSLVITSCKNWERVLDPFSRPAIEKGRIEENFGEGWEYRSLPNTGQPAQEWEIINVPHTMKIEPLVVNNQWQGTAVYRKTFNVETLEDRKWFFYFEGVMQEAEVFINGSSALSHKGGFLPFTVDATPFLKEGEENRIQVVVTNTDNSTIPPGKALNDLDFNLYGGIYRKVHLIKTGQIYITDAVHADRVNGGGILVNFSSVNRKNATGEVKVHLKNESESNKKVKLNFSLEDANGKVTKVSSREKTISSGEDITVEQDISIENPELWSISNPNLYRLKVEVVSGGEVLDKKEIRTGIRDIELTGEGFYLNGEKVFINGTNRHQEYPYVGYALSDEAQYRDAYKIKQAGFDFVRLSHYPHATAFLDACDELGLLVMNAIPGWQYYEDGEFAENAIRDIKDMARRDRNHPSVVFWENSLNESGMPEEFMVRANEVLKAELPYDDTYTAGWIDHPSYDLFIPARQHAKPPFYWQEYNKPNRPVFIAEYGDWEYYAQNAGFNQKEFSNLKEEQRSSRQLRSAGEAALLQQALNFQEAFNSNLKGKQTIGHANWLMYDYNRGYSNDLEASGVADIFRIPKFSFYFYQSQKAPGTDDFAEPMVFIASFWTPKSSPRIKVFSNTQEVALYLNDRLVERKKPDVNKMSDELSFPPFTFNLDKFTPGTLKAVGYIDGKEVASFSKSTPGKPANIDLAVDFSNKAIATNTPDVVFLYAIILDENETVLPDAENIVSFTIAGNPENVKILGGSKVKAEAGIATILLRIENYNRPIKIRASSEGLEEADFTIE